MLKRISQNDSGFFFTQKLPTSLISNKFHADKYKDHDLESVGLNDLNTPMKKRGVGDHLSDRILIIVSRHTHLPCFPPDYCMINVCTYLTILYCLDINSV